MADLDGKNQEIKKEEQAPEQESFVRERVLNRAENRRRWISRIITLVGGAIIFGAVSCLVFVLLKPHAEQWFHKEEPESLIYVPKDEEQEEPSETEPGTDDQECETQENIKDVVESAVESYQWTVSDYESLYRAINGVSEKANQGIVTVTTKTQTADWFDNPIETEGRASGIIWNITSYEILILTGYKARENETTVEVTFSDGTKAAASVKAADGKTGIAIVSVPAASVDETVRSGIAVVPLGNSIYVKAGQPVLLVGNPKDYVGSVAYGMISYVRQNVQKEDMEVRMICTDVAGGSQAGGFVLNTKGEIVGMVTEKASGAGTNAIGISDLKTAIERLSNGSSLAYLGITGQDVTAEISESNEIPRGVYVSEAVLEGPAYNSGIQSGDVITGIDSEEILTIKMLQKCLEARVPGEDVTVMVQRIGREGYTDIEFPVTLGTR